MILQILLQALKKLFSGTVSKSFPERPVYAITGGAYVGEFFVYIEKIKGDMMFLSIPKMEIRAVPYDKYVLGMKDGIMDRVEDLPKGVYTVCMSQYRKNKDKQ